MSKRLQELARRKAQLIAQCEQEREDLAAFYHRCRLPFGVRPPWASVGRVLKAYPLWVVGATGLLLSRRLRGMAKTAFAMRGLWPIVVPLWSWWSKRSPLDRSRSA